MSPRPGDAPRPYDPRLPERFQHVSASQLKTFAECKRKWWLEKVIGVHSASSPAMDLGTKVHGRLEHWALTGEEPDPKDKPGRIARTALHLLPPRGPDLLAEAALTDPTPRLRGVPVQGFIDLHHGPRADASITLASGAWVSLAHVPLVIDFKTTSAFGWAKTAEDLKTDPQAVLYARWAAERYGRGGMDDRAHVRFLYLLTGDGYGTVPARPVDLSLTYGDTFAPWSAYESAVEEMKSLARVTEASQINSVPPTWDACGNYRGCPHRGTCYSARLRTEPAGGPVVPLRRSHDGPALTGDAEDTMVKDGSGGFFDDLIPSQGIPSKGGAPKAQFSGSAEPLPHERLHLYVGCLPVRGAERAVQLLDAILAEHSAKICAAEGVADLALVPFGKGKGLLAASLRADPPMGVVVARSGPNTDVALEVLRPMAHVLVEGVR